MLEDTELIKNLISKTTKMFNFTKGEQTLNLHDIDVEFRRTKDHLIEVYSMH